MIDVRAIQGLYRYNRWPNSRIFEAVSSLSPEEFARDLGSSHPSVRDTLLHIVWAEWIWLQRWNGVSARTAFQATDFPSLDALRARWSEVEIEQRGFLEALIAERPSVPMQISTGPDGATCRSFKPSWPKTSGVQIIQELRQSIAL